MRSRLGKIYTSTKWFFTGTITASHCKRGSDMKRQAALVPGGKGSVNSLAASIVIVGERLSNAGCLLFGSDRASLKADTETLSSCYLSWGQPGIFPTDRLNFTTVCCERQYRRFRSLFANVCLDRALKIRFDVMHRRARIHPTPPLPVGNGTSRLLSDPDRYTLIKFLA